MVLHRTRPKETVTAVLKTQAVTMTSLHRPRLEGASLAQQALTERCQGTAHRAACALQCRASSLQAGSHVWQRPQVPNLQDGILVDEARVRANEVGANRLSSIITVSNMLQVRRRACMQLMLVKLGARPTSCTSSFDHTPTAPVRASKCVL